MFIGDHYIRPWLAALMGGVAAIGVVAGIFFSYPFLSERISGIVDGIAAEGTPEIVVAELPELPEAVTEVLDTTTVTLPLVGEVPVSSTGTLQLDAPGMPKTPKGVDFLYIWDTRSFRELTDVYRARYELAGWEVGPLSFDPKTNTATMVVWNNKWQAGLSFSDSAPGTGAVGILQGYFYLRSDDRTPEGIVETVKNPQPAAPQDATGSPSASPPAGVPTQPASPSPVASTSP